MALSPGTRLGPYELVSLLGAGGMGEVYRARDTKLNRDVALKILPDAFARDSDRLARFTREAQTLASLNHSNIAAIYGIEESGEVRALVMELVHGEDLSQQIARGAIPLDETLPIARQIAEALEAAHEQGIVHRDLKPANIKLRPDGMVKVLDFGLAKMMDPAGRGVSRAGGGTAEAAPYETPLANSPTMTSPAMMTGVGMILGTAAYMSPEQAKGRPVDKRSDVWAFGCVLYEMLTGKQAFAGDDVSDTLAFILTREPDWSALPAAVPIAVRTLLRRCLTKERKQRLDSAVAARLEIDDALTSPATGRPVDAAVPAPRVPLWRKAISVAALIIVGLAAGYGGWTLKPAAPRVVTRLLVSVTPAERLSTTSPEERRFIPHRPSRTAMAWSPDGQRLVFSAIRGDKQQLYTRALDQLEAVPMAGTEESDSPFFSSDGQWVGFWKSGELKKMPAGGGPAITICKTPPVDRATWGSRNLVVFARAAEGLWQVSGDGGTPQPLTTLDATKGERGHVLPQMLPDGKAVLFTIRKAGGTRPRAWDDAQIVVRSLVSGDQTVLIEGGADARYVSTGHLVYARQGTLMAVPFDLARLAVAGSAVGIVDSVMQAVNTPSGANETGAAQFSVSGSGTLVYVPGGIFPDAERSIVWVNRSGAIQSLPASPKPYLGPRLSPDGQRVALFTQGEDGDVWIYDLVRGTLTRFSTTRPRRGTRPVWTPDGTRLTFGAGNLFWKPADGTGIVERLTTSQEVQLPESWSPDGKTLAFFQGGTLAQGDIWVLSVSGSDRTARPFVQTAANERWPDFSPDGRWLAYASDESGRDEVYVQPYPGPGPRHLISVRGGTQPLWARNGRELFYTVPDSTATADLNKMMVVDVTTTPTFTAGIPRPLDSVVRLTMPIRGYDVSADGQRFLTVRDTDRPPEPPPAQMIVVQNWFEELKRLVPTK